ncbi:lipopolysaccharide biosynthesis protein [Microbacterium sp. NPDC058345]|uniref:lipopolysaccharide biosynthesis protein n=1 Tax=Microbacterium sp. NPDC058345 TaxID=3346455 RepID=UPI003648D554
MSDTYDAGSPGNGLSNVKWNGVALAGKQIVVILFSLVLARLLGPNSYGIVAQATVYIAFTTLILDQGVSASLISRKGVDRDLLGASMTLNVVVALCLALATWPVAVPLADFLNTSELTLVLPVLGLGLLLKGMQVVPRMLLVRRFHFRALAFIEVGSALLGGIAGVVAAVLGADYWAIVVQLLVTDVCLSISLLCVARPPRPNARFTRLREIIGFSVRVFAGSILSFGTRNIDTVLIARYLGETAVGHYSLAYRVLLMPVQMVGQTVSRVIFPSVSRDREDPARVSTVLLRSTRAIAAITFPLMTLIAVSSHDTILVILGTEWLPAAPIMAVLAITGARQSITVLNAPTMLGFGRADMQLRFMIVAAVVQVGGMIAGLSFGAFGVALGYTIAGIVLTPVIFWIQKALAGSSYRAQLLALAAPAHASAWGGAAYAALFLLPANPGVRLAIGAPLLLGVYLIVLRVVHARVFISLTEDALGVMRGGRKA